MKKHSRRELLLGAGAAVSAGLTARIARSATPRVVLRESAGIIELENEYVRARFAPAGKGIKQEYFARSGRRWIPILTGLRPPTPRPADTSPLYADRPVARDYRILVSEYFHTVHVGESTSDRATVVFSGMAGSAALEQIVSLRSGSSFFHFDVKAELAGNPPKIEYVLASFVFEGGTPDYAHAPCLKREAEDVIADRVFHSPAVVLQKQRRLAALAPIWTS